MPEDPAGGFRELVFIHHFLTGEAGENDMLEAMQAGADDYLVRPFDQLELKARLLVGIRREAKRPESCGGRRRHPARCHDPYGGV